MCSSYIDVVKEFTLNRCSLAGKEQMMTPDREACCGVVSTAKSLMKIWKL